MIRLNLFMIWFLHFLSLLSVICRYYRQNSSSRILVVLVYTVSTLFCSSLFLFYLILHSSLFTLHFLYPSCLKDFLFGIVDFLELALGSSFDIVAKGGYTVGMMLESKLAVGSLDLLVGG